MAHRIGLPRRARPRRQEPPPGLEATAPGTRRPPPHRRARRHGVEGVAVQTPSRAVACSICSTLIGGCYGTLHATPPTGRSSCYATLRLTLHATAPRSA